MTTDLAVIEAALAAATPGPWWAEDGDTESYVVAECVRPHPITGEPMQDRDCIADTNPDDARAIATFRNAAAELVERVKAAEAEVERLRDGWSSEARADEDDLVALESRAEGAEATIARVRELAESVPKTIAWNPSDAAYLSGQVDFAESVLDALNHTDGISPESGTSGELYRFTSANSAGADDTTPRARAEDATEPILRPTDQRYEPPADDHESGCCRG